jgi:hypothetical protein
MLQNTIIGQTHFSQKSFFCILLDLFWHVKVLQEETFTFANPSVGTGRSGSWTTPEELVDLNWATDWTGVSSATRLSQMQALVQAWWNQLQQFTPIVGIWTCPFLTTTR